MDRSPLADAERAIRELRSMEVEKLRPSVDESALDGLKFSACLPVELGYPDAGGAPGRSGRGAARSGTRILRRSWRVEADGRRTAS